MFSCRFDVRLFGLGFWRERLKEEKGSEMEVMTLVFFAGGFFGQLSIVVIRLRAILKFASQLLTCVHLPPDCEFLD